MRWRGTVLFCVLSVLMTGSQAYAWDSPGHQQIADIAWSKLNQNAKKQIALILGAGDAQFRPTGVGEDKARSAFRKAATFPDFIKEHRGTSYEQEVQSFNDKFHPVNDPLISPTQQTLCKSWHFLDTPIRFTGTPPARAKSNALAALTLARMQLSQLQQTPNPDRRMQAWWLCWIEHVVGDLHQPLHCASSFQTGHGDEGGNLFKLGLNDLVHPDRKMALHSFWDAGIDHAKKSEQALHLPITVDQVTARWNGDGLLPFNSPEATNLDVMSWITKGSELADQKVYSGIAVGGIPDSPYKSAQESLCKRQAVLAGYRLANLLNGMLGN